MRCEIEKQVVLELEKLCGKKIEDYDLEIFKSGILDSLNSLHIILFMEKTYKININPFDISIDALGSVNKICNFIESKI